MLKGFVVYGNLTRVQLHITCVENSLCLVVVVVDEYKIFSNENFPNYSTS